MDNLQAYKCKKVSALIERLGYEFIYLPPSSPDLNSIEKEVFWKLKQLLRKATAHSRQASVGASIVRCRRQGLKTLVVSSSIAAIGA